MADRLDDEPGAFVVAQRRRPRRRGAPLDRVDAERLPDRAAVDRVDPGQVRRARRLQHIREQQPDRALPDHGHAGAAHVAEPAHRIEHRAERLDHGGVDGRQLVADRAHVVGARHEALRQAHVPLGPPDHAGPDRQVLRRARLHHADSSCIG
jgi:hypothetical protein